MGDLATRARDAAVLVLRRGTVRKAALDMAAARGRGLVLVYHRLAPRGEAPHEVVPSLSTVIFRRQLEILGDVGDIVPAAALLHEPERVRRLRFALTFDDDYPSHYREALPLLRQYGVPATFFLSGRSAFGLGPYWWILLERMIAERGVEDTRRTLGVSGATPAEVAAACERPDLAERIHTLVAAGDSAMLERAGIRALAHAGMTIGFHTLRHPVLTHLSSGDLARALREGRDELAAIVGRPVSLFAYPHGRADRRVARCTRAAGYRAAFATGGRPVGRGGDVFRLGRWEPGPLADDEFLSHLALRLNYPIDARRA